MENMLRKFVFEFHKNKIQYGRAKCFEPIPTLSMLFFIQVKSKNKPLLHFSIDVVVLKIEINNVHE
jgi:hypothetical protein